MDISVKDKSSTASFSAYNKELQDALNQKDLSSLIINDDEQLSVLLNGMASTILQQTVPQDIRKNSGIFFTSHSLSEQIAGRLSGILTEGIRVHDPACGAGNLLLACAKYLPIGSSLENTIEIWSGLISGSDLFDEFIIAAKLRLILLAAIRSKDVSAINVIMASPDTFPHLTKADLLSTEVNFEDIGCIVVNPPFGHTRVPDDCDWATGTTQIAAWFVERIFRSASPNQHILAILPDVLRSGTRYGRWRNVISSMSSSLIVETAGRFDTEADVDVFILDSIVRSETEDATQWPDTVSTSNTKSSKTVSDYFNVSVGTIVPHRDPKQGDLYPYLHARNAKKGQTIVSIAETVRTNRKVFNSPFVAIHRTSSPNDKPRCVASIINEKREVAVENHIIVVQPKSGNLDICTQLVDILNSEHTNNFMNRRIRCRHLTVSSINEIPWIEE